MYTVSSIMPQLVDPEIVLEGICETLKKIAPGFTEVEHTYYAAVDALLEEVGDAITPSAAEYIEAKDREICAKLIYVAWLGFQQNLECFQNPVNTLFLKTDFEDFHRERRMHTLPEVQKATKTINAFHEALHSLPEKTHNLTDGIIDYICYMETTALKLAHYFGFILANDFLPHIIPGYCMDPVTTMHYTRELRDYLQVEPDQLL